MLIYICLFALICMILSVSSLLEDNMNRYLLMGVSFIILWVFASIRYEVGTDYKNYWNYFFTEDSINDGFEPFYVVFYNVLQFFHLSPFVFFSFASFVTLALFYLSATTYSNKPEVVILLFILTGLYTNSFNVVRHFIALAVFLYFGYRYLVSRDFWKYTLAVLLAATFHMSALVMLPFYFFIGKPFNKVLMVVLIVVAVMFNLGLFGAEGFTIPGLPEKYSGFLQLMGSYISKNDEPLYLKFLNNVDKLIILFVLVYYRTRLLKLNPNNIYLINLYFIFCVFTLATRGLEELQRLGYYFYIFSPFAIALIIDIPKDKYIRFFLPLVLVSVYFIYFIVIILSKNYGDIIPYQTFLSR